MGSRLVELLATPSLDTLDDLVALAEGIGPVEVAEDVEELAGIAMASEAGRPGLRFWQDRFVSAYLCVSSGLVCALSTGLGKTVCAGVVIIDPAVLVRHCDQLVTWRPDDLIVDEGDWLRASSSKRTRAARRLREVAGRATRGALNSSGRPRERSGRCGLYRRSSTGPQPP